MAYIYLLAGDRGIGKSNIAQKLGLEFAASVKQDLPNAAKVSEHIHNGDNVVVTTPMHAGEAYDEIYKALYDYALIAGTVFVAIDVTLEVDGRE